MKIKKITRKYNKTPIKYYDIEVEEYHNFFITKSKVVAHNSSIEQTIIQMAQNFVGSNNLNLISPVGQYGTRLKGGDDASASRYIFTNLEKVTRYIFDKRDDDILNYLQDDGYNIEPDYYIPIIPMVLVNGSDGIGTGWSSFIPQFNPNDIITYIENKLKGRKRNIKLEPWYKGHKGEMIYVEENNKFISRGKIKKVTNNRIKDSIYQIYELPVGIWNDKYCVFLEEKLIKNRDIVDWDDDSTDEDIDIKIRVDKRTPNFIKKLHLEISLSLNNMILFDEEGKIKKYNNQYEIIDEFFDIRLEYYKLRKEHILKTLEKQKLHITNKMKFINGVLKKQIIINNKTKKDIENQIIKMKIDKWNDSYDYLLNLPLINLSKEKLLELKNQFEKKKEELEKITSTTIEKMWTDDLNNLKKLI